jgi:integrase
MSGYIRKKGKNSFQINIYTGQKDKDGKRQRITETVHGSKVAKDRLVELQYSLQKGTLTTPGRTTLADWLHKWLDGYVKTNCSERTLEGYSSIIEQHLIPALGQIQLKNLRAQTIQAYYGKALEKLSARTVHHQHRVLSQALKYAVRQGYLGRNPAEMVDPPQPRKNQMRTLTAAEVETLLTSVRDNHYYPVIYTAVSTGLRQAEILGLRWRDLDLDMASISVSQVLFVKRGQAQFKEPKTSHSRRRVSMTPKLAIFLREYKAQREVYYNELGQPMTLDTLVFTTPEGNPVDASELSHVFSRLASQAVLGHVRFHDLRHTFASLMLLRGAKPKVISEALGHASVGFTMDVYSHIIEGMQQDAMALLDEVLPVGINSFKNKINANLAPTFNIMVNNN